MALNMNSVRSYHLGLSEIPLFFQFEMRRSKMCNVVCRITLDAKTAKEFKEKIDDEYRVNMYVEYFSQLNAVIIFMRIT